MSRYTALDPGSYARAMSMYSADQIYGFARRAGFSPDTAATMTAIALAESGGESQAHAGGSRGLWRIDVHRYPDLPARYDLHDPQDNAEAAYEVSRHGSDISPWTVTHGGERALHLRHREEAQSAAIAHGDGPGRGVWTGSPSATTDDLAWTAPGGAAEVTDTPGALLYSFGPEPQHAGGGSSAAHDAIGLGDGGTVEAPGPRPQVRGPDAAGRSEYAAVLPGDGDQLTDAFEPAQGLDPHSPDSDADGHMDGGLAPLRAGAGLDDADEQVPGLDARLGADDLTALREPDPLPGADQLGADDLTAGQLEDDPADLLP